MFNFIPVQGIPLSLVSQNPIPAAILLLALVIWFGLLILKAKEHNDYISSSFVASSRTLGWSTQSSDRARLLVIRFHPVWRHPDCTVMRWYDDQNPSSRRFRSIEHRRDVNAPFFHEFLLFKLTDGAICRLERTGPGEGSRVDVLQGTGCPANDIVQWFDRDDYARSESMHRSELISEVSFPFEYDILDVLAVCYSVQNIEECRVYTLQRYNAYFLCLTVLAILTRRAANWETEIGPGLACELFIGSRGEENVDITSPRTIRCQQSVPSEIAP
ncbi:hypothetical protein FRC10_006473 [Ceratobasidium sp. 414]|nr:hypothetical protein FRC10_006473 [Ceratobasidium sp. 414]